MSAAEKRQGDLSDAMAYIGAITADGKPREFRFIKPGRSGTESWTWAPGEDVEGRLRQARDRGFNAYVTINPIRPDAIERNKAQKDGDIDHRAFIPIDVDPVRPSGTLATPEQVQAAKEVADDVLEWYRTNFPDHAEPIVGHSGSGFQTLIPCDIPANKEGDEIVAGLLGLLGDSFDTKSAHVDRTVKNRSRIMRVCGTEAFYSDGSRFGHVVSLPSKPGGRVLTVSDLREIVPKREPEPKPAPKPVNVMPWGDAKRRLDRYIERILDDIRTAPDGAKHSVLFAKTAHIANHVAGAGLQAHAGEYKARIREALQANPGHVASWEEADDTIDDAWSKGIADPITLPDREPPTPQRKAPAPDNDGPKATYDGRDYHDPLVVAEAFVKEHNSRIAYAAGVPYEFRGGVYRQVMPDDLRAMLYRFANEWFARHHDFEQGEGKGKKGQKPIRPVTRKVMADLAEALAGAATNLGVVTFPSWAEEPPKGWTSANTVNCANGLLNIDTLEFIGHTPQFMSLAKSKAAWHGENAECREFDKWLSQVLPGKEGDTEAENSRENLLAFMGYLLVPDRSIHKALSIVGQRRTGKGTILRLIRKLVGEGNVATTSLTEISGRFGLEPLLGKLVASINDARPGKSNSDLSDGAERLLQITGGDTVSVDRKNRSALPSVDLPVRFVMASNGHLNMPDPNAVLPSRLVVLRFDVSFYGRENSAIEAAMERELPGILAKCVMAYREMRKREGGFHLLKSTQEAQEISERLAQPLVEFIGDVFEIKNTSPAIPAKKVYHAYVGWFTENCPGHKPISFTRFRTEFGGCKADVTTGRPRAANDSREWLVFGVSIRDGDSFAALVRSGMGYVAKHAGIGTSWGPLPD